MLVEYLGHQIVRRGRTRSPVPIVLNNTVVGSGEVGRECVSIDLSYAGDFPCNTHGGQLSFGQPGLGGGMSHVTEAVRQLMGRGGARQVKDARFAYVNGNGGIMSEQASLILERRS